MAEGSGAQLPRKPQIQGAGMGEGSGVHRGQGLFIPDLMEKMAGIPGDLSRGGRGVTAPHKHRPSLPHPSESQNPSVGCLVLPTHTCSPQDPGCTLCSHMLGFQTHAQHPQAHGLWGPRTGGWGQPGSWSRAHQSLPVKQVQCPV